MALAHNPRIITDGLVLCLDAANSKSYSGSGTTWTDLSGNGNHGTATNGAVYNSGGYFSFDGVNDYISLGDLDISTSFSLSIWFRGNSSQPDSYIGLLNKSGPGNFGNWGLYGSQLSDYVRFGFRDTGGAQREISNSNFSDIKINAWVNYVGTYDFSNLRLYRNGVEIASAVRSETPESTNDIASIGGRVASNDYFFQGQVAVASIHTKALTADEVAQNFAALRGRFGI